jgi:circadian clock protein KaiC
MADCAIHFDQRVVEQVPTRRIRVIKYRGSSYVSNECPFVITEKGIHLIPTSQVDLQHKALGSKVSSGHPLLDAVLDGGYRRASSILISGTSGTGKTTLANTFAAEACKRGEKVLFIGFEESQEAMVSNMLSPGIDLSPALQDGKLRIMTALPEARGAEEHLFNALQTIEAFQPDHVIVDAISSCKRMGTQQAAYEYVMRLANACKEKGITIILTNQTEGFQEEHEISGVGISSIIDAVILLRYIEVGGEMNRMLLVMKARGQKHSNQYREFLITDHGIDIADLYVGEGGVLTGVARQEQEAKEAIETRRRQLEIKHKEHEIKQKRAEMEAEIARRQAGLEAAETELKSLKLEESLTEDGRDRRGDMRVKDTNSARLKTGTQKSKRTGAGRKEGAK